MNKKNQLLMCMLLCFGIANAQGSKEGDFKKAVDHCACRIAYAYTNQYAATPEAKKNGEKISFKETIKPKIENCEINSSISDSELKELLSNNNFRTFSDKFIPVIATVKKLFKESLTKKEAINTIIDGFYENPDVKDINNTFKEVGNLKDSLKNELNNSLTSFKEEEIEPTNLKNDTGTEWKLEIKRLENSINSEKAILPNWLSTILILSSFLLSILSLFFLFKKSIAIEHINKRIDEHKKEIGELKSDNSKFEGTTNKIISNLKELISELRGKIQSIQKQNEQHAISKQQQRQEEKKPTILFAPAPEKDGSFNVSVVVSSENQSSSFYKFTLLDGPKAEFEFINSERAIRNAVNSYEMILQPVCTFKNALNQNAKRIITNKKGIVRKQNDKWVLDTKAEITYE